MLLLLPILFLNPVAPFGFRSIGDPFEYPSKQHKYDGSQKNNFIISYKIKDELTGKDELDYRACAVPDHPDSRLITASSHLIPREWNQTIDSFVWKCVTNRDNGKLSAEPFRCLYKMGNGTNVEMIPGESSQTYNGSIKHYCDISNGGLRKVTEYVSGCYHNGSIYTVDEEWSEENPGDKNSSHRVMVGCRRGESGYFEKEVRGCRITKSFPTGKVLENGSYIETNETYTHEMYMELNGVEFLSDSSREDRKMERCVETEPGHVAMVKVTEEEVGCTFKNEFRKFYSYWKDLEMGAVLRCDQGNKITKPVCLINGTEYHTDPNVEHKLSNGCTFICHSQKNIYKCPDQLKFMEVIKTATTRIPTTLRAEFGF